MSLLETHSTVSTEAVVVADLATQASEPRVLAEDVFAIADGGGKVRVVDIEKFKFEPRRAKATRTVLTARSFVQYLDRHGDSRTEIYAAPTEARVVAILDSNEKNRPGWQDHTVTLNLTKSPSWLAWEQYDGKLLSQVEFAEFIELQAQDVRDPSPAVILELAQHFEAKRSVDFESSERMADGQVRLGYKETVNAKAGQRGDIEIPTSIKLALRPYIGGPVYGVVARFRYRLHDARLTLGYVLERPQLILESAFDDVVTSIIEGSDVAGEQFAGLGDRFPLFTGQP